MSGDADADAAAGISPLTEMPEMTSRFPEMLSRISARDRAVYALDLPRYEAHLFAENKMAQASVSWLSGASLGARSCLRLLQAPASLGQSAAWSVLAGHSGLSFDIGASNTQSARRQRAPRSARGHTEPAGAGLRSAGSK